MKSRREIKDLGREAFLARYWPCVGAVAALAAILAAIGRLSFGAATLILSGPLTIGANFFFINIFIGNPGVNVGTMFEKAFDCNFGRKLGGYLWMQLFVFLWSLLLVIPGIIKALSYAMTPYILGDCPNVRAQDALKLSMRMMDGHKGDLFVFYLSYIGWVILSALTVDLLGFFYVFPWISAATAGWYLELREECLRFGVVTPDELNGGPLTQ